MASKSRDWLIYAELIRVIKGCLSLCLPMLLWQPFLYELLYSYRRKSIKIVENTLSTLQFDENKIMSSSANPLFIKLCIPDGLEEVLEGLAREVLRRQPKDINRFAAIYFHKLLTLRSEAESCGAQITLKNLIGRGKFIDIKENEFQVAKVFQADNQEMAFLNDQKTEISATEVQEKQLDQNKLDEMMWKESSDEMQMLDNNNKDEECEAKDERSQEILSNKELDQKEKELSTKEDPTPDAQHNATEPMKESALSELEKEVSQNVENIEDEPPEQKLKPEIIDKETQEQKRANIIDEIPQEHQLKSELQEQDLKLIEIEDEPVEQNLLPDSEKPSKQNLLTDSEEPSEQNLLPDSEEPSEQNLLEPIYNEESTTKDFKSEVDEEFSEHVTVNEEEPSKQNFVTKKDEEEPSDENVKTGHFQEKSSEQILKRECIEESHEEHEPLPLRTTEENKSLQKLELVEIDEVPPSQQNLSSDYTEEPPENNFTAEDIEEEPKNHKLKPESIEEKAPQNFVSDEFQEIEPTEEIFKAEAIVKEPQEYEIRSEVIEEETTNANLKSREIDEEPHEPYSDGEQTKYIQEVSTNENLMLNAKDDEKSSGENLYTEIIEEEPSKRNFMVEVIEKKLPEENVKMEETEEKLMQKATQEEITNQTIDNSEKTVEENLLTEVDKEPPKQNTEQEDIHSVEKQSAIVKLEESFEENLKQKTAQEESTNQIVDNSDNTLKEDNLLTEVDEEPPKQNIEQEEIHSVVKQSEENIISGDIEKEKTENVMQDDDDDNAKTQTLHIFNSTEDTEQNLAEANVMAENNEVKTLRQIEGEEPEKNVKPETTEEETSQQTLMSRHIEEQPTKQNLLPENFEEQPTKQNLLPENFEEQTSKLNLKQDEEPLWGQNGKLENVEDDTQEFSAQDQVEETFRTVDDGQQPTDHNLKTEVDEVHKEEPETDLKQNVLQHITDLPEELDSNSENPEVEDSTASSLEQNVILQVPNETEDTLVSFETPFLKEQISTIEEGMLGRLQEEIQIPDATESEDLASKNDLQDFTIQANELQNVNEETLNTEMIDNADTKTTTEEIQDAEETKTIQETENLENVETKEFVDEIKDYTDEEQRIDEFSKETSTVEVAGATNGLTEYEKQPVNEKIVITELNDETEELEELEELTVVPTVQETEEMSDKPTEDEEGEEIFGQELDTIVEENSEAEISNSSLPPENKIQETPTVEDENLVATEPLPFKDGFEEQTEENEPVQEYEVKRDEEKQQSDKDIFMTEATMTTEPQETKLITSNETNEDMNIATDYENHFPDNYNENNSSDVEQPSSEVQIELTSPIMDEISATLQKQPSVESHEIKELMELGSNSKGIVQSHEITETEQPKEKGLTNEESEEISNIESIQTQALESQPHLDTVFMINESENQETINDDTGNVQTVDIEDVESTETQRSSPIVHEKDVETDNEELVTHDKMSTSESEESTLMKPLEETDKANELETLVTFQPHEMVDGLAIETESENKIEILNNDDHSSTKFDDSVNENSINQASEDEIPPMNTEVHEINQMMTIENTHKEETDAQPSVLLQGSVKEDEDISKLLDDNVLDTKISKMHNNNSVDEETGEYSHMSTVTNTKPEEKSPKTTKAFEQDDENQNEEEIEEFHLKTIANNQEEEDHTNASKILAVNNTETLVTSDNKIEKETEFTQSTKGLEDTEVTSLDTSIVGNEVIKKEELNESSEADSEARMTITDTENAKVETNNTLLTSGESDTPATQSSVSQISVEENTTDKTEETNTIREPVELDDSRQTKVEDITKEIVSEDLEKHQMPVTIKTSNQMQLSQIPDKLNETPEESPLAISSFDSVGGHPTDGQLATDTIVNENTDSLSLNTSHGKLEIDPRFEQKTVSTMEENDQIISQDIDESYKEEQKEFISQLIGNITALEHNHGDNKESNRENEYYTKDDNVEFVEEKHSEITSQNTNELEEVSIKVERYESVNSTGHNEETSDLSKEEIIKNEDFTKPDYYESLEVSTELKATESSLEKENNADTEKDKPSNEIELTEDSATKEENNISNTVGSGGVQKNSENL